MGQFATNNVSVFPSSLRSERLEGKYNNEENFTGILTSITDRDSYVISKVDNDLVVVIGGYLFKLNIAGTGISINNDLYLWICVETTRKTLVSSVDGGNVLDNSSGFTGIQFGTSEPSGTVPQGCEWIILHVWEPGGKISNWKFNSDSIIYNGHEDRSLTAELDSKQDNLKTGFGLAISEIPDEQERYTISISDSEKDKLESLSNKGSNDQFVYFDSNGKAVSSSIDKGKEYTAPSGSAYVLTQATYTKAGVLKDGTTFYASQNAPTEFNNIGNNGDIWFKYAS